MDDAQELSTNSHHSGGLKKVFSRSNRSHTTHDAESTQGSVRSNGRSSVDSTLDKRPATAGGELTVEDSPNRLSKLLTSRRKKKNNNNKNKPIESIPSADSLVEGDDDEPGPFPPLPTEGFVASESPVHGNTTGFNQSTASINLLTDDSETDQ
jgi:hypothetical protein